MKTIGLIGGMSWESTVSYYKAINREVARRLGGFHSAEILLYSVEFSVVERQQREGRWDDSAVYLSDVARRLEAAGADMILICANTMHLVAPQVQAGISIPLIHIVDPTAERIRASGLKTVGLTGTRFTMEEDFYKDRLQREHGLRVHVPELPDRDLLHRIVFEELVKGEVREESRQAFRSVVGRLVDKGCEGVILGCTEFGLLLNQEDSPVPLFETASIHAEKAVDLALAAE
jgi:aspartate racemase